MLIGEKNIISRDGTRNVYSAPGLIDLQVNGVKGIDFNNLSLSEKDVLKATKYLLSRGVTSFFPTLITNADENIVQLLTILSNACDRYPLVKGTIGGFHLEGPFISPKDGARGAHERAFVKPPDWELFQKFQKAAKGKIKLVTLAPEWDNAADFIKKCHKNNILVSMGHSLANKQEIERAVDAGLILSTHLGNGVPPFLKRHPNILWNQLAEERLTSMIIADGHHLPDNFIKIVMRVKRDQLILVSDTTRFAGLPSGEYETFIGGKVLLTKDKKLAMNDDSGLLAGSAKDLLECVMTLTEHGLATLEEAWELASVRVRALLESKLSEISIYNEDRVIFENAGNKFNLRKVIKNDEIVYENEGGQLKQFKEN